MRDSVVLPLFVSAAGSVALPLPCVAAWAVALVAAGAVEQEEVVLQMFALTPNCVCL